MAASFRRQLDVEIESAVVHIHPGLTTRTRSGLPFRAVENSIVGHYDLLLARCTVTGLMSANEA